MIEFIRITLSKEATRADQETILWVPTRFQASSLWQCMQAGITPVQLERIQVENLPGGRTQFKFSVA